ncbi:hypothetical protein [Alistipes sp. An116]|nr:hypothetical protein [Alistipes sp. An116]
MKRRLASILTATLLPAFVTAPTFAQKITSFTRITGEALCHR